MPDPAAPPIDPLVAETLPDVAVETAETLAPPSAATAETLAPSALDRSTSPPAPSRIGRFAVLDLLGEGGMGRVFAAYDPQLDRRVAVKVLHGRREDAEQALRIQREAHAMARVSHPNVVQIYDVGQFDGRTWIAMEFVPGRTLSAWQAEEARPWRAVVELYARVGAGLSAAHEAGLIHRDFKPDNVLVGDDGRPRIIDFGLARAGAEPAAGVDTEVDDAALRAESGSGPLDSPLTRDGSFLGTPAYMSPEQMKGRDVGPASDQFAFCLALYEALFGRAPFDDSTLINRLRAVEQGDLRAPPSGAGVPRRIVDALSRGLAADPADRWPSMAALLDALGWDASSEHTVGWQNRLWFFMALWAGALGATGVSFLIWPDGVPDVSSLLLHDVFAGVVTLTVIFRLRRVLLASAYNRRLFAWLGTLLYGTFVVHIVAHQLELSVGAGLAFQLAAGAVSSMLAGFVVARWAFGTAALLAAGSIWVAAQVDAPLLPYGLTTAGAVFTGALGTWIEARRAGVAPDLAGLHAEFEALTSSARRCVDPPEAGESTG